MDDPDVLEVWNLVFMQFNREKGGELRPLPAKSVDTGMGFERLVSILQNKRSNYDTDVFSPIFAEISRVTGAPPYGGKLGDEDVDRRDTAYRIVADHIRTLSCAIADGAVPSNEGRGYVLRRILRRAVRYGRQMLGGGEGFFTALVPSVAASLGETYPELLKEQARVQEIIADEEAAFSSMLSRGIKEFNARAEAIKKDGRDGFDGKSAFFLYDSMGFPLDLTELMAREAGLTVDVAGFDAAMAAQKARSAAAANFAKGGEALALGPEQTAWLADNDVAFTDDTLKFASSGMPIAEVRAIYAGGQFVEQASDGDGDVGLILDRTAFFAQAGGQVPDTGSVIALESGAVFEVNNVQSYGGYVMHSGTIEGGTLMTGAEVKCSVNYDRRLLISKSHTLTHVMNLALHTVLGDGVSQKGSLVDDEKARFDFSHNKAMSHQQLKEVEELVQANVAEALPLSIETVPLDKALEINNLRAVFGERYPDPVRVVSIGPTVPELLANPTNSDWAKFSIELCGGTHIPSTDEMSSFALVEESAVAKGVRRVVGVTGDAATKALATGEELKRRLAQLQDRKDELTDAASIDAIRKQLTSLKLDVDQAVTSAHLKVSLRDAMASRDKELIKAAKQLGQARTDKAVAEAIVTAQAAADAGKKFVVLQLDGMDSKSMQPMVQKVIKKVGLAVLVLSADEAAGKVAAMAAVPKGSEELLPANQWLKVVLDEVDGRGGGKANAAQGSGTAVGKVPGAIEVATAFATSKM